MFRCLNFENIGKGNLVARCKLEMPSGLILTCNVLRKRSNPSDCFVLPVAERLHGGGFAELVGFTSEAGRQAWSDLALEAVRTNIAPPQASGLPAGPF